VEDILQPPGYYALKEGTQETHINLFNTLIER